MCGNCKEGHSKKCCTIGGVAKILVIIGGLNWGIVGLGMLFTNTSSWNLVDMLLGSMPTVVAIVYLLVGFSALMMILRCKCRKCENCVNCVNCVNGVCGAEKTETQGNM